MRIWERLGRPLSSTPALAVWIAGALLLASLALGLLGENTRRAEDLKQAQVQSRILAQSLAAPLAFDDLPSIRDYLAALKANPAMEAAAAYDLNGRLVAGFGRPGVSLPRTASVHAPILADGRLTVTAAVRQGTTNLGSVYLSVATETALRRITRYLGIGLVVLMACLLIAALGRANSSLSEAHRNLQKEVLEREKAEAALRQAQKMEAMGQLTGGVAHDFNNILMVASSGLDLMARTKDPTKRQRLESGIREAIERGASLTQQLLTFSRKSPMKTEVVDVAEQLRKMQNVLDRSLREDISVRIEASQDLWPVEVDPAQFEVAVLNIAINARDAMPQGGRITVRLANAIAEIGDVVEVAISDSGLGIAPELISHVFEPFFTTKEVGKGTGLGLSQVYGFARASGGDVRVESVPGAGTTVTLQFPRSTKPAPQPVQVRAQRETTTAARGKILVVEDDDRVASLVGEMLCELGYEFSRADNAASALQSLRRENDFDVIFSDMIMPGEMNGLDLARAIAAEHIEAPVILTTGYSASAAEAAAEGHQLLVKPYRIDALAHELQSALQRRTLSAAR